MRGWWGRGSRARRTTARRALDQSSHEEIVRREPEKGTFLRLFRLKERDITMSAHRVRIGVSGERCGPARGLAWFVARHLGPVLG